MIRRKYTVTQTFVVEKIPYSIMRFFDDLGCLGRTVSSPCGCLGNKLRCHTTNACPWLEQRTSVVQPSV